MQSAPLSDFVSLHAAAAPDRPALIEASSRRTLTYAGLEHAVRCAAGALARNWNVAAGDRVAVLALNCPELVILQLACARIGAILVPLNWRLSHAELETLLADCEPKLLAGDEKLETVEPPAGTASITIAEVAAAIRASAPLAGGPQDPDRCSLMLYTSGTSGQPKGVLLTERNLFATAVNFSVLGGVGRSSVFLGDAPMFHVIGMVTNLRPAFLHGAATVISPGFDAQTTLERLGDPSLGITHYFCVPQMADMLRAAPGFDPARLRGLTALFTGGAPHPAPCVRQWLDDGIAAVDGFGMTETGTVLGMPLERDVIARKAGSAGLMPPTLEGRLVDAHGADSARDAVGELLLRGPNVFTAYWRRPEETANAFAAGGWFRTGDLARRDADGFYYLVDRRKDMFISGGENVYPAEIETVLAGHPDIIESAVVGLPDPKWGESGHAAIVPRPGSGLDAAAVRAYCEARLARFKVPKKVHFVDALPRTGSGKIVKSRLRKHLALRTGR